MTRLPLDNSEIGPEIGPSPGSVEHAQPTPTAAPPVSAPAAALGHTVTAGAAWMLLGTLGGKSLAFIAQIVLGWWMTAADYAVFGVALAVSGFVAIFKDGGVRDILVQRGRDHYENLLGPVFWLGTSMNIFAAFLTGIVALVLVFLQRGQPGLLSDSYNDPWLPWMLVLMGVAVALQSPAAVLQARLRLDLRFAALSRINMWSALLRNILLVSLAWWLRNPLAFILPMIAVAIYEGIASYRVVRESPWKRPALVRTWGELLSVGGWMILQSAANILFDLATFAVIGVLLPQDVVGIYVFAYTWIAQIQTLMGFALLQVLFSALARLQNDLERMRQAVLRAQRVQMLIGALLSLGLAVIMPPLESLIWSGKWAACNSVVLILGVFFPFRVSFGLSTSVMLATGSFRQLSLITLAEGILVTTLSAAGALLTGTADGVAWGAGLAILIGRIGGTVIALRHVNITFLETIKGMFPAWLVSLAAAAIAIALARVTNLDTVMHDLLKQAPLGGRIADFLLICLRGGTFCLSMLILSRLLLSSSLRDILAVTPARFAPLMRRILFLPA